MDGTSSDEWNGDRVIKEEEEVKPSKKSLIKSTPTLPDTIRIRLLKELNMNTIGKVTGKKYRFMGAGYELDVDARDAVEMLKRRGSTSCCGSTASNYFEIVT